MAPAVDATPTISTITGSGGGSGGNGSGDGSNGERPVIARGVCWNTAGTPTTADRCTVDGSGTGTFFSTLSGLDPSTTYHVRAYATNAVGTSYGPPASFTTLEMDADGDGVPDLTDNCRDS